MRQAGLLALTVFALVWLSAGRTPAMGDAALNCRAALALVDHGRPDLPAGMRVDVRAGRDGRFYSKYPLLASLTCLPAAAARSAALPWIQAHPPFYYLLMAVVPAALAGFLVAGFFLLLSLLETPRRFALALSFSLIFATPLWIYARNYYGEILQAALYTWLLYFFLAARKDGRRRDLFLGGLMLGLILNAKAVLVLGGVGAVFFLWGCGRQRWRDLAIYGLAGLAPGLAVWLGYNALRYGSFWALGYVSERDAQLAFSTPLWSGLYGLLFSSGKSLFLYAPLLGLVPFLSGNFIRRYRRVGWLILGPALILLALNAKWWAWHGDWGWGPRLLFPLLPALALPLAGIPQRRPHLGRLFLLLTGLGILVQLPGVIVSHLDYLNLMAQQVTPALLDPGAPAPRDDLLLVHFVPELSPLAGHLWVILGWFLGKPWALAHYPWRSLEEAGREWVPPPDLLPNQPDLWFAGQAGYAVPVILAMGLVLFFALRAWRRMS